MKKNILTICAVVSFSFSFTSCDIINPAEDIPAYIYVSDFSFTTDAATEGSASEKITDVWVTVGDQNNFLGAYSLPALIPILATGEQEIILSPGIKDNGITATPEIYIFYKEYRQMIDLKPGIIDTIHPSTRYLEQTKFAFIEDFEREGHIFQDDLDGNADSRIIRTTDEVFEGNYSGLIVLDTSAVAIEVATTERFRDLMAIGVFVYLEVNYKAEAPVIWGIIGHQEGIFNEGIPVYDPGFAEKDEWNKIYFNLTQLLIQESTFVEYQISLRSILPFEDGEFTKDQVKIWLDNIKLVHF